MNSFEFFGFARYMRFYRKRIAGLIRLVISAVAWVKFCTDFGNNTSFVVKCLHLICKSISVVCTPVFHACFLLLNGPSSPIVSETPGFFNNISIQPLFYCKSKRVRPMISGVKPGVSFLLKITEARHCEVRSNLSNITHHCEVQPVQISRKSNLMLFPFIRKPAFFAGLLLLLAFAGNVNAATIISTGTSGNWKDATTWIGGVVPGEGDDVIIDALTTVIINSDPTSCKSITINGTLNSYRRLHTGD